MAEIKKDKDKTLKPYNPAQGSSVTIHLDLQDLCKKTISHGPLAVLGETLLNLCLLANDTKGGILRGSNLAQGTPRKSTTRRH